MVVPQVLVAGYSVASSNAGYDWKTEQSVESWGHLG